MKRTGRGMVRTNFSLDDVSAVEAVSTLARASSWL